MNRDLALSALVAAALHGGLFFAWPKSAAPVLKSKPEEIIKIDPVPRYVDELEPEERAMEDRTERKPDAPPPVPMGEDHVTIADLKDFKMPVQPKPNIDVPTIDRVPPDYSRALARPAGPIFRPGDLDRAPRTRVQTAPIYPFDAKKAGLTGVVQVEFSVDENGRVTSAHVVSATDRVFEESTLKAVLQWRFEPGTRKGERVPFRMIVPVQFSLND